ncbi:transferase, partial [Streptomyces sp. TRM76130]|nr:transferase [Streptomyces sp. TRM76130]
QNLYLEVLSRAPFRRDLLAGAGTPLPFAVPVEAHVVAPVVADDADRGPGWRKTGTPVPVTTEGAR